MQTRIAANTPSDTNFTYVSNDELSKTINAFTHAQYGQDLVAHIGSNQAWLNNTLIYEQNLDKEMILMELRSYLAVQIKTPLAQVFTHEPALSQHAITHVIWVIHLHQ